MRLLSHGYMMKEYAIQDVRTRFIKILRDETRHNQIILLK